MAGNTTTGSLADSKQFIIDSSRMKREYDMVHMKTTEAHTLPKGTGVGWDEITLEKLTAQTVSETTILDNPQEFSDSLLTLTPTMSGLNYVITDQVYQKLPSQVTAKLGPAGQSAIERKKDQDYLAIAATATTTLAGTGQTLTSGILRAGNARIRGNVTEASIGEVNAILHSYGLKDLDDEIVSGVGTYAIPDGVTQDVFLNGFVGVTRLDGVRIWRDDNIAINSTPDARGMIHSKEAVLYVQGYAPRAVTRRREEIGGGADEMFHYDDYVFGERGGGVWLYGILHDATVPAN